MGQTKRTIEVDEATAVTLERRASELGLSVGDLVAEIIAPEIVASAIPAEEMAELDRRWARVEAGEPTIANEDVVRWLKTWGTPSFKPWSSR